MTVNGKGQMSNAQYAEADLWEAYHNSYSTLGGVARALGISHAEAEERYQAWLGEREEEV